MRPGTLNDERSSKLSGTAHAAGRPASPMRSVICARRGAGRLHARHTPHRRPRPPPSAEPAKKLSNRLCLAQEGFGICRLVRYLARTAGPHATGPGSRTRLKVPRPAPSSGLRNHRPPLHADALIFSNTFPSPTSFPDPKEFTSTGTALYQVLQ
jgi:hypothetical protein